MVNLTDKQKKFISEYLVDLNATQAAIRAGYSAKTANRIGAKNMTKPEIVQAIAEAMKKREKRTEVTADRVIEELAKLAFFDIRKMFDDEGKPLDISMLDDATAASISGIEVLDSFEFDGEKKVFNGHIKKYKLSDKKGALEQLGRHLGIFNDKLQLTGNIAVNEAQEMIDERLEKFKKPSTGSD